MIDLAKGAGITILRFPGGCGTHHYNWKKALGKNRMHFLFGVDEFLKTCSAIGAEPIFTVSYFTGSETDAADLVRYLQNTPYRVKYFEIGNEDWHGDHQKIKGISPQEYATRYLKYYKVMKAIDPSIQIGAILWTKEWNTTIMDIIKDKIDFGISHIYPSGNYAGKNLESVKANDIFRAALSEPELYTQHGLRATVNLLAEKSGKSVPLAITEYNCGFVQEKPLPYRHCLGTALVNTELLKIFMRPESNVLMANYWQFCNSYWGMVANGFDGTQKTLNNLYYKRPNYYIFEMYAKHFGDILIDANVECDSYEVISGKKIPYLFVNASKSKDGKKLYLMVINKNMDNSETITIELKDFVPVEEGNAWVLNGPSIDATNEEKHDNVKVTHQTFRIASSPSAPRNDGPIKFEYTFEPHSLTAIELTRYENPANK